MRKRVFVFGATGTNKREALLHFAEWCRRELHVPTPLVIDFERDYLFNDQKGGTSGSSDFLEQPAVDQYRAWREAWEVFQRELPKLEASTPAAETIIAIHGCVTRGHYGIRCAIDVHAVAELRPSHIVTLIDDVYDMWWRTQRRAAGYETRGMPTLEHLVQARRTELVIADQVARACTPRVANLLVAVSHPCRTLWNWLYGPAPRVIYLSFPISQPRRLAEDYNDESGFAEVDAFIKEAYQRQSKNDNLVVICPLGIDELPLRGLLRAALSQPEIVLELRDDKGQVLQEENDKGKMVPRQGVVFDRDVNRWNLNIFWPPHECLSAGPPPRAERMPLSLSELRVADGILFSDVGWRDYRLVEQARYLAVLNPRFKGKEDVARGVMNEIEYARGLGRDAFVFQDERYDPERRFDAQYPRHKPSGSMPPPPSTQHVYRCDSIHELFDELERFCRQR